MDPQTVAYIERLRQVVRLREASGLPPWTSKDTDRFQEHLQKTMNEEHIPEQIIAAKIGAVLTQQIETNSNKLRIFENPHRMISITEKTVTTTTYTVQEDK